MLIEDNILRRIDPEDIIDGVFIAPDEVLYVGPEIKCADVVKMILPNVLRVFSYFLKNNKTLEYLEMPNVEEIGNFFLLNNCVLKELIIPKVKNIGYNFLPYNNLLESIYMPNIEEIGNSFLWNNDVFKYTPKIVNALSVFLYIGGEMVNKKEYLRKLKIEKILC